MALQPPDPSRESILLASGFLKGFSMRDNPIHLDAHDRHILDIAYRGLMLYARTLYTEAENCYPLCVHYMHHGGTPCLAPQPPKDWPPNHKWSGDWRDVTCPDCLKSKPQP